MKRVQIITQKPKSKKSKTVFICLLLIISFSLYILFKIESKLLPLALNVAEYQCKALALSTIQKTCNDLLNEHAEQYQNLYTIQQDDTGKIQSIVGDMFRINSLEDTMIDKLNAELKNTTALTLTIPAGSITGWSLFNGLGPLIPIKIIPLSLVSSELQSQFSSCGVNQTKFEVFLHLQVDVGAVLAGVSNPIRIESDISIAQIIIVGEVPVVYSNAN